MKWKALKTAGTKQLAQPQLSKTFHLTDLLANESISCYVRVCVCLLFCVIVPPAPAKKNVWQPAAHFKDEDDDVDEDEDNDFDNNNEDDNENNNSGERIDYF